MSHAVHFGLHSLRRRPLLALVAWSLPEMAPAAVLGLAVARAVDAGFLAGRPLVGLAWLGLIVLASLASAAGSRQVLRRLGDLVEPVRDDLVQRVVTATLWQAAAGRADNGAVARLTRQVEVVRDTYGGLIVSVRAFAVSVVAAVAGLLSLAPVIVVVILPPFLVGVAAFLATLGVSATRARAAVLTDERVAVTAGLVLAGTRDVMAAGAEAHAAGLVEGPVAQQAAAERGVAAVAALRTLCFAVGGWLPILLVLAAGPWLVRRGLTAGEFLGGLTYVLFGLQPALSRLMSGLGGSGLRFAVTLGRILDASAPPPPAGTRPVLAGGYRIELRGVTFAYGPQAAPILRGFDLTVPEGDHLAIVGPSGIGKSTLASILCGLTTPDAGTVAIGGVRLAGLGQEQLAGLRVLIPQEAYVFTGTVAANLRYLRPRATGRQLRRAVAAVGAGELVDRLGGLDGAVDPGRLSAGERQLLALARAFLAEAPVVVLDEATCHLDPAAERRVEEAFAARPGTVIVIAHRMSSAQRADRVLVLDGDRVDLCDPRDAVSSPLYAELLARWQGGSQPAFLLGDAHGVDARAAARLGHDPREVVADGAGL